MKKHSEQALKQSELITFSAKINQKELRDKLKNILSIYYNFENALMMFVSKIYKLHKKGMVQDDFEFLLSPEFMINALYKEKSKQSEKLKYFKNKYECEQLWETLKETSKKLNPHNLSHIIERVETKFNLYIESLETSKPLKLDELTKIYDYSVELDKHDSLSLARLEKDHLIGIRLSNGLVNIGIDKEQVKNLTGINKIHSVKVVYNNGNLYLEISYLKESNKAENDKIKYEKENNQNKINNKQTKYETKNKQTKYAGIDIGERNLMAVFIDDETTKSLLIDGKPFKDYSKMVDKLIDQLDKSKSKNIPGCDVLISLINLQRNEFFHDKFYKITKYVVEYLHLYGVTDLYISEKLANHKFIQIPFIKLIDAIKNEAKEYGIEVYCIDESFTSQVSCISGDIKSIQKNPHLISAYNGKLNHDRSLFFDIVINKKFHADLNAAVNHIKVRTDKSFEWLKNKLFKLKKPIKIKSDQEFEQLLRSLKKSKSDKHV
jgi:IS605 OrfB family transposase